MPNLHLWGVLLRLISPIPIPGEFDSKVNIYV